ncbi:helix-turn-helix domain-containing protein [Kitasatospora sp. NPDC088346]|uniref:helix-turn-helix domain-containing protein n=1 Tax=Kitasatospora sp. NPDC088346 TaxID=3364073 RepID=UPI003817B38F
MAARRSIGQRVARHREASGLSRARLAEEVGRNADWLRSVESGRLPLDRYTMVHALAAALDTDPVDLLGRPTRLGDPRTAPAHRTVPALRRALLRADLPPTADEEPPPLDALRRRVDESDRLRRHGHYGELGLLLPPLLEDLRAAADTAAGTDRDIAHHLLTEARHDAAMLAKRLGHLDLAATAAAQAHRAAAVPGDPLLVTAAQWLQAEVCLTLGATAEARRLIDGGLARLDGLLTDTARDPWSLWGTLHLVGAVIEAQHGRQTESTAHLAEAATAADRVGEHPGHRTEFSAGERAVHLVHAALELGADPDVLDRIAPTDLAGLPRERRARHGIDRARLFARAGDDTTALEELLAADRLAPEAVRAHPLTAELVLTAAHRSRTPGPAADAARHLAIPL